MAYTKANLESVGQAEQTALQTEQSVFDSSELARSAMSEVNAEIDVIGQTLESSCERFREAFLQIGQNTGSQLAGTDWEGSSRETAVADETTLRTQCDAMLGQQVELIRTTCDGMRQQAQQVLEWTEGQLRAVFESHGMELEELARGESLFGESMADVDAQHAQSQQG